MLNHHWVYAIYVLLCKTKVHILICHPLINFPIHYATYIGFRRGMWCSLSVLLMLKAKSCDKVHNFSNCDYFGPGDQEYESKFCVLKYIDWYLSENYSALWIYARKEKNVK